MAGPIKDESGGIIVPVSTDLSQLRKGLEEVKRIGQSTNKIPVRAEMSWDERQVTNEANKMIARMEREAARVRAKVMLFGDEAVGGGSSGTARSGGIRGSGGLGIGTGTNLGTGRSSMAEIALEQRANREEWLADERSFREFVRRGRVAKQMEVSAQLQSRHLLEVLEEAAADGVRKAAEEAKKPKRGQGMFGVDPVGWRSMMGAAIGVTAGLSASAGMAEIFDAQRTRVFSSSKSEAAERGLASIQAASSIPVLGDLVRFTDALMGATRGLKSLAAATESAAGARDAAAAAGFSLAGARAARAGDAPGAALIAAAEQSRPLLKQRGELEKQLEAEGFDTVSEGLLLGRRLNSTGKKLKEGIADLDRALESIATNAEEAAAMLTAREAGQLVAAEFAARGMNSGTLALNARSPRERAQLLNAAAASAFASRSTARATAAGEDENKQRIAAIEDAADASRTRTENEKRLREAAFEQDSRTNPFADGMGGLMASSRSARVAREASMAATQLAMRRDERAQATAGQVAMLRAQGRNQEADRLAFSGDTDTQLAGMAFPLTSTLNFAQSRPAMQQAMSTQQQRERTNASADRATRIEMAGASGRGMDELASMLGTIAGGRAALRNLPDSVDPVEEMRAQFSELRAARDNLRRPRGYAQFGDALSEAAGGPGGDQGRQMVDLLSAINGRMQELVSQGGGAVLQ